jgi:hypothetical protein
MSSVRIGYVLASFGILITTGGCAESATAPEAASFEVSANRFDNPTTADAGAAIPVVPTPAAPGGDGVSTMSSGFITGGGRAEP